MLVRLRLLGVLALLAIVCACAGGGTTVPGGIRVPDTAVAPADAARGGASPTPVYTNATPTARSLPVKIASLPTPAQLTIEAAVRCDSTTGGSTIMAVPNAWVFSVGLCNGAANPDNANGAHLYDQRSGKQVAPGSGLAAAATYFVAGVRASTGLTYYACAYPKGACRATVLADPGTVAYSGTSAYIGTASDGVSRRMSGSIWDLALYAAPLSAAQIQAQADAMRPDPYPSPLPAPVFTAETPTATSIPLKFSGLPTPSDMTIEATVKCDPTTAGSTVMSVVNGWIFAAGTCDGGANPDSPAGMKLYEHGSGKQVVPAAALTAAATYFIAGVHTGTDLIFYVCAYPKGACHATAVADAGKLTYDGTTGYIGAGTDGVSRKMSGSIWDVALYATPLSAAQIQAQADAMRTDPYPTPRPSPTINPCVSGGAGRPAGPSLFTSIDASSGRPVHLMLPRTAGGSRSAVLPADMTTPVTCHGGPIQNAPKLYFVFWGSAWNDTSPTGGDPNAMRSRAIAWVKAMGGSGWKNDDTQYVDAAGQAVGNGPLLYGGEFDDTVTAVPAVPQFADLANEAARAAGHFGDLSIDANYVVLTPYGTLPAGYETQYCAWHSYTAVGSAGALVPFTNMPYVADSASPCGSYSVNPAPGGITDGVSIILGHEQAETETDPLINAWYDAGGEEIGDKCAWYELEDNPNAHGFPTQPLWSNANLACRQTYP